MAKIRLPRKVKKQCKKDAKAWIWIDEDGLNLVVEPIENMSKYEFKYID